MAAVCPTCEMSVSTTGILPGQKVICPGCGEQFSAIATLPMRQVRQMKLTKSRSSNLPQSGPGMASFVIGFFGCVWMTINLIVSARGVERGGSLATAITGLAIWFMLHSLWATLGLALGIAGSLQKDRDIRLAYLGIALNGVPLSWVIFMLIKN